MVTVAVAGGTGGLGKRIVYGILETKKHNVIVLSRSANPEMEKLRATVKTVDYSSHKQLVDALQGVHTVISVLSASGGAIQEAQIALVRAAKEVGAKRFAPSEFVVSDNLGDVELFAPKAGVWEEALKSGLECTRFGCGIFMNILGTGTPRGEEEALGGLRPWNFVINVKAGTADLPGDGNSLCTFTTTTDIGKFVAASLDLEKWEHDMTMVGETMSFRDMLALCEKATKRKFLVKENTIEEMKQQIAAVPATQFYNEGRIVIAKGHVAIEPMLNKLCPQVKPMTVEEYLKKWWEGVDLPAPQWEEARVFGKKG